MDDLALLRLLQLFDSQFPVGGFAHSGGLETYAALGGSLPELREVLDAQIALGWGRSELGAACLAWRATGSGDSARELDRLARTLDAVKVVPAVREMSIGLGRRTADLLHRLYPGAAPDLERPHHALVVGTAGRRLGIEERPLLLAFGQSLATGTLAAAVRCMPVSSVQAQEVLIAAQCRIGGAVERALADPEGCLFTCTPALDIRSHQQAHLHTRLFQS
jgi:urease accessory protein